MERICREPHRNCREPDWTPGEAPEQILHNNLESSPCLERRSGTTSRPHHTPRVSVFLFKISDDGDLVAFVPQRSGVRRSVRLPSVCWRRWLWPLCAFNTRRIRSSTAPIVDSRRIRHNCIRMSSPWKTREHWLHCRWYSYCTLRRPSTIRLPRKFCPIIAVEGP